MRVEPMTFVAPSGATACTAWLHILVAHAACAAGCLWACSPTNVAHRYGDVPQPT